MLFRSQRIPDPGQVKLAYQTNGSIYPDQEWWEMINDFHQADVCFSIDGIGRRFEYVRANLSWQEVDDNIQRIIRHPKIKPGIHATMNPLNVYYFNEVKGYYLQNRRHNKDFYFSWHPSTSSWDLRNCTPVLREVLSRRFSLDHLVNKVLEERQFVPRQHAEWLKDVEAHEIINGFDGAAIFPEIYSAAIEFTP